MVCPRMGSHDRIHDNSRSYVVIVVAHKSPQLEFSNLPENFARKLTTRFGIPLPCRVNLFPSTRIFLLVLFGRIKKSRLPSRAQMYVDKGRRDVVMGSMRVELNAIFTPVFLNSRSYGIGSHKLKSTRALAHEGTRRPLSFRLLLFSVRLRAGGKLENRSGDVQLIQSLLYVIVFSSGQLEKFLRVPPPPPPRRSGPALRVTPPPVTPFRNKALHPPPPAPRSADGSRMRALVPPIISTVPSLIS
ncbi:hypothetical protein ALC57_18199 [Trachymyrmex cornetzi]|uniref:Uncharacterized protein n=1 Tax=Trachymyrmex cornetzi TaxID=471704 RepID=A0A195D9W8_9HYME|nr:hypothetical protein ALC57_18199 [Trachymyrmex cornetzi]